MGQSRGWALALPGALVLFVLVTPGRVRLLAAIAAVALACLVASEPLLAVSNDAGVGTLAGRLDDAVTACLGVGAALALVGLVWALAELRVRVSAGVERGLRLGLIVVTALALAGLLAAAAAGEPEDRLQPTWQDFKYGKRRGVGPLAVRQRGQQPLRLLEDRVGALRGGADTRDRNRELPDRVPAPGHQPRAPPLPPLAGDGRAVADRAGGRSCSWAARCSPRCWRRWSCAARPAAGGRWRAVPLGVAGYWFLHASVDWFWEFAGLTAPAFAMLGAGRRRSLPGASSGPSPRAPRPGRGRLALAVPAGLVAVALALTLVPPWISKLQTERAGESWQADPAGAFDQLDSAAALNPLATDPPLTAATIALSLGRARPSARRSSPRPSSATRRTPTPCSSSGCWPPTRAGASVRSRCCAACWC